MALLYASKELEATKEALTNFDQQIGVQIVQNALRVPLKTIADNAGMLLRPLSWPVMISRWADKFMCGNSSLPSFQVPLASRTCVGDRTCEGQLPALKRFQSDFKHTATGACSLL